MKNKLKIQEITKEVFDNIKFSFIGTKVGTDVDGTLINFDNTPNYDLIDTLRCLKKLGCSIYCASGGGTEYAKHWCEKLGLLKELEITIIQKEKNDKIDIFFDDELVDIGRVNIQIKRNQTELI